MSGIPKCDFMGMSKKIHCQNWYIYIYAEVPTKKQWSVDFSKY